MNTELNITALAQEIAPRDYSASRLELGQHAGAITWGNAKEDALTLFGDQFNREAFDDYFSTFGAWDAEELAAHTDEESAALMLQFIAGDMREAGDIADSPFDWDAYEASDNAGRIMRSDDGTIYYHIGS